MGILTTTALFAVFCLSTCTNAFKSPKKPCNLEKDCDYNGFTVKTVKGFQTALECKAECDRATFCLGYTMIDRPRENCYLKNPLALFGSLTGYLGTQQYFQGAKCGFCF